MKWKGLFNKPDVRKTDEDIMLGDQKCIRAYMIAAEKVDIDYSKGPEAHIPYPVDAVQYARFASKLVVKPGDDIEREEQKQAKVAMNELHKRNVGNNANAKFYLKDFENKMIHNGQRIADKINRAHNELKRLDDEKETLFGKTMQLGDIAVFRLGSGYGTYKVLTDTTLGDVRFNLFGHDISLRDLAIPFGTAVFALASGISYSWKGRKERAILRRLRDELDETYREAISDSLELLRRYYPETLVPIGEEEVLAKRKAAELKKKYRMTRG